MADPTPKHKLPRIFSEIPRRYWKLSISQKMHLGFFPMVFLIFLISVFALSKLQQINRVNSEILNFDIPARTAAEKMRENIFDQESFIRRYMVLKDKELIRIYQDLGNDIVKNLDTFRLFGPGMGLPLARLENAYNRYSSTLLGGISLHEDKPGAGKDFDARIRAEQGEVIGYLDQVSAIIEEDQNEKSGKTAAIGNMAFNVALVLCVVGILLAAAAATLVTGNIVSAVKKLQNATEFISQGKFDHQPEIKNNDELGDLADAFTMMATRLKNLEEMYLDASPLTRLPGGVAIENILKKKIEQGKLFAFCLMDIDNFKSYNDYYGYSKGNKMIQETASMIEKCVKDLGSGDDFVGHIGGDDFVVITTPDRAREICEHIVEDFDRSSPAHYDEEDRRRGYIFGEDRQRHEVRFPLASISIAVVSNQYRALTSHIMVSEIAAEIKEHAKSISGSTIIYDQRHHDQGAPLERKIVNFPGARAS